MPARKVRLDTVSYLSVGDKAINLKLSRKKALRMIARIADDAQNRKQIKITIWRSSRQVTYW